MKTLVFAIAAALAVTVIVRGLSVKVTNNSGQIIVGNVAGDVTQNQAAREAPPPPDVPRWLNRTNVACGILASIAAVVGLLTD